MINLKFKSLQSDLLRVNSQKLQNLTQKRQANTQNKPEFEDIEKATLQLEQNLEKLQRNLALEKCQMADGNRHRLFLINTLEKNLFLDQNLSNFDQIGLGEQSRERFQLGFFEVEGTRQIDLDFLHSSDPHLRKNVKMSITQSKVIATQLSQTQILEEKQPVKENICRPARGPSEKLVYAKSPIGWFFGVQNQIIFLKTLDPRGESGRVLRRCPFHMLIQEFENAVNPEVVLVDRFLKAHVVNLAFGNAPVWMTRSSIDHRKKMLAVNLANGDVHLVWLIESDGRVKFKRSKHFLWGVHASSLLVTFSGRIFFVDRRSNKPKEISVPTDSHEGRSVTMRTVTALQKWVL